LRREEYGNKKNLFTDAIAWSGIGKWHYYKVLFHGAKATYCSIYYQSAEADCNKWILYL